MRSILEKAIVALLNEEHEQAEALFHRFMVERARQIHESLRQGEDVASGDEDITNETYFTEDDLSDLVSDDSGVDDAEGADEVDGDVEDADAEFGDAEDVDADLDGDFDTETDLDTDADLDAEPAGDDRFDDLQAQLDALTSEFEAAMAELNGGESDTSDDSDLDLESDVDTADVTDNDFTDGGDTSDVGSEEADEFDDITESIISELEKVSVTLTDGKEAADGKSFTQNKDSTVPKGKADANDAKPHVIKSSNHTGFERETAPGVKALPKRKNTRSHAEDGNKPVSKEGDKSASLNKDFAGKSQG